MPTFTRFRQSNLAISVLLAICGVVTLTCSLFLSPRAFAQSESASVSGRLPPSQIAVCAFIARSLCVIL